RLFPDCSCVVSAYAACRDAVSPLATRRRATDRVQQLIYPCATSATAFHDDGNRDAVVAENQCLVYRLSIAAMRSVGRRDGLCHQMMVGRAIADRVGIRCIAGEQIGLAAAAPEVLRLLRTTAAGLAHPARPAEMIECRRVVPDGLDGLGAHIGEGEAWQHA